MKNVINKIGKVLQLVLAAPIKLPGKALNIVRYIALGLGIVESVLEKDTDESKTENTTNSADVPSESSQAADPDKDKKAVDGTQREGGTDALE